MRQLILCVCAVFSLCVLPLARSAAIYDSLSSANTQLTSFGFGYFGDAITLSGTSEVIGSLKFRLTDVRYTNLNYMGNPVASFQAFFYNLNPGTDGVFQTGDEIIGPLIGSSSVQTFTVPTGAPLTITLTEFSVTVPQNFLWIVHNPDVDAAWATISSYGSVVGGSSAITSGYWSGVGGAPVEGWGLRFGVNTGPHNFGSDFAVELGTVPEPSAVSLLALGLGVVLRRVRRKAD